MKSAGGSKGQPSSETLSLSDAVTHLLEECRMVLPGVQALFGFQLIAVFNSTFHETLTRVELTHMGAMGLVMIAIALVMAPAAYHRQTGTQEVTTEFLTLATRLLLLSMFPLMLSIAMEFYLIARLVLNDRVLSFLLSLIVLGTYTLLWFLLPRRHILVTSRRRTTSS